MKSALVLIAGSLLSGCVVHTQAPAGEPGARSHEPRRGEWVHLHSAAGPRYRFARNLTGHDFEGELYISFYEHISDDSKIFLKKWGERGWEDIPLPQAIQTQRTNRQKFVFHEGTLYMSFLTVGLTKQHIWNLYRRDDGVWSRVGEPIVYENFKWGIVADDFAFSPTGELYRIWSGDDFSKLERFTGTTWKTDASLPSAGFYEINFDAAGRLVLGIGEPKGKPGIQAKVYDQGKFTDVSQGFAHTGLIHKYRFPRDANAQYAAFRGDLPSRGFHVYRYGERGWQTLGKPPIAFSAKGDSGDDFGFTFFEGNPVLSYRDSGMDFIPMVLRYTESGGWAPIGTPGFVPHNVSTPRVFTFQGKLYLFFSWHDYQRGQSFLETYRLQD